MKISKQIIAFILLLLLASCRGEQQPQTNTLHLTYNQNIARQHASLVFSYLSKGYTDRAQENMRLALDEAPLDPVVLDTAGYYFEKTGDLRTANFYYRKAVMTSPTSGIVKNNYGAFLCRNGKYKASVKYFLEASKVKDTPITQEALRNAECCYKKMQSGLGGSST